VREVDRVREEAHTQTTSNFKKRKVDLAESSNEEIRICCQRGRGAFILLLFVLFVLQFWRESSSIDNPLLEFNSKVRALSDHDGQYTDVRRWWRQS